MSADFACFNLALQFSGIYCWERLLRPASAAEYAHVHPELAGLHSHPEAPRAAAILMQGRDLLAVELILSGN
eukprot:126260-Rhodomonas_salina.1